MELEPGTAAYIEDLLEMRREYAPWMADVLGYAQTRGLDVLDVGCGQGIDVTNYALSGANVTGVDLTPRHVELARLHTQALGLDVTIVQGDAEQLPFEDDTFDRVSSNGVLHHTPDLDAALREVRRVLRPGGQARIVVYNKSSLHYWLQQVVYMGLKKGLLREEGSMQGVLSRGVEHSSVDARPLVNVYTPRQLRRAMSAAGFGDVKSVVRHYAIGDAWVTGWLHPRFSHLEGSKPFELLGRAAGWYVTGIGAK